MKSFIVHGHDTGAKFELKDYLQNTLGLPEPIILDQQASKGMTVIEKFEHYAADAEIAFSLFTPDDTAEENRQLARQNVLFEYGYFLGKFGRKSGRVFILHKGTTEIPSDLRGVVFIDISSGIAAAGEQIRTEIENLPPTDASQPKEGFERYLTPGGDYVLKSTLHPELYICENCYSEDGKERTLPAPGQNSGVSTCRKCNGNYRIRPRIDPRINFESEWR